MRTKLLRLSAVISYLGLIALLYGCESPFFLDGDDDAGVNDKGGYYYLIDNARLGLVMLDTRLNPLQSWSTASLSGGDDVTGLAFDGRNFWMSVAGDVDKVFKVSGFRDTLVVLDSFDAPPGGRGTIRDLAWDGSLLWAINSGSETFAFPPRLYKLDPETYAVVDTFDLTTPGPRALTYVGDFTYVYDYGAQEGLYYTDVETDFVYMFDEADRFAVEYFETPEPPRGSSYRFAIGLTFDGEYFWMVNSSSAGDHLYRLDYNGAEKLRIEIPYVRPGAIVWSRDDARLSVPEVDAVAPNVGIPGDTLSVAVYGSWFLPGAGLQVDFGAGITVFEDSLVYIDESELHAAIVIDPGAALGARDIIVINPTGKAGVGYALFAVSDVDPNDGYIWAADANNGMISKIRISDGTVVQEWDVGAISSSNSVRGLAFDGTHMWLSMAGSEDRIFQLNTDEVDLQAISSIPAPPGTPDGAVREIAFDEDGALWVSNVDDGDEIYQIYKVDKTDGTILDTIDIPGTSLRGITFADGRLYGNDFSLDAVYVYDFSAGSWSYLFDAPVPPGGDEGNRYPVGMTWDGVNFWMGNSTYEFDHIFQITKTGHVIGTIDAPNQGDAQVTGIAYTAE
jgi:hypothetical protein